MSEIKINIDNLDYEISELKALAEEIKSKGIERPAVVGGGTSIQALEDIGLTYEKIQGQLGILVSNTASFMQNVRDTAVEQDKKIAQEIARDILAK